LRLKIWGYKFVPKVEIVVVIDHQANILVRFHVTADDLVSSNEPQELLSNQIFCSVFEGMEATIVSPRVGNVLAASCAESGSWMQLGFGTVMNSPDFRISFKRRIGISVFINEIGYPRCTEVFLTSLVTML